MTLFLFKPNGTGVYVGIGSNTALGARFDYTQDGLTITISPQDDNAASPQSGPKRTMECRLIGGDLMFQARERPVALKRTEEDKYYEYLQEENPRAKPRAQPSHSVISPTTSPDDAGFILFASDRDGDFEIYRINPDGSDLTQLTDNPAEDTCPSCSPDGRKIAFISTRLENHRVFVMSADGAEAREIADMASETTHITWSPDSRRLVCDLKFGRQTDLYLMNDDGSEHKELVKDGMWPSWSPDGKTIAFNRGNLPHVFLVDADGGNVRPLRGRGSAMPELSPMWSPDGNAIMFTAVAGVETDKSGEHELVYEIMTVSPGGGSPKSVLKTKGNALSWSPDGRKILLVAGEDDKPDLFIANTDGTGLRPIAESPSKEMWGCWCRSAPANLERPAGTTTKPSAR